MAWWTNNSINSAFLKRGFISSAYFWYGYPWCIFFFFKIYILNEFYTKCNFMSGGGILFQI